MADEEQAEANKTNGKDLLQVVQETTSMDDRRRTVSPSPFRPVPSTWRVGRSLIEPLLNRPDRIRNVCILAHVDHGKTTLTDSLLASNGIISFKQAGTLRYMDAREDEQERGITMESSAVSLLYDFKPKNGLSSVGTASINTGKATPASLSASMESLSIGDRRFLINLIDSPGHVDFSSQVMTAAKLCDGCLVLVDAVEGVCTQTAAVLRQAHANHLKPCLVINKMDRLITELRQTPTEAAEWLFKLLAQVNAIQATVLGESGHSLDEEVFNPSKGNVLFASATDGWAFTIGAFATILTRRLDMKEDVLRETLWGQYFFEGKAKRVIGPRAAAKAGLDKPLFAQMILENIWPIYEATSKDGWDQAKIEKIANGLGVKLPLRELKARDGRTLLRTILTSWLPLAECAFGAIVDQLPNPLESSVHRLPRLFHWEKEKQISEEDEEVQDETQNRNFDLPSASVDLIKRLCGDVEEPTAYLDQPVIAYLSKQFAVTMPGADEDVNESVEDGEELVKSTSIREKLIGMGRLFHGSLAVGQTIYVLRPKYQPGIRDPKDYFEVTIKELFLLMGRDLEPVERVFAGNVFGIGGLEEFVGKSATLSDTLDCPSFDVVRQVTPIVRVAVHPLQLQHMSQLETGLKFLCQADPCAETYVEDETGEHILATAGELHLEQCLKDLRERFTRVEIQVSPPMVPFRETITEIRGLRDDLWATGLVEARDEGGNAEGILTLTTPDGTASLSVMALPLSDETVKFLSANKAALRHAFGRQPDDAHLLKDLCKSMHTFKVSVRPESIIAVGPRREGTNLLLTGDNSITECDLKEFSASLISGFQLAVEKGPLCAEPISGVAFVIQSFRVNLPVEDGPQRCQRLGMAKGQMFSVTKDACHRAFLFRSPRLQLAFYSCDIQATAEVLGRVYSVVARRLGTILAEDYNAGTGIFTIRSLIPVPESFGFADDIRGRTSGLAIPQLLFNGFHTFDQDPFWLPTTEEELEEFGEVPERANAALRYLVAVRKRKGLHVDEKLVASPEKQRTLKK